MAEKKMKEIGKSFFKRMHEQQKGEMKKKHKRSVVRKAMIANVLTKKDG